MSRVLYALVDPSTISVSRTLSLTALALAAFAANSVLCRLALLGGETDAASFTLLRLLAGAGTLAAVATLAAKRTTIATDWRSGAWLFVYAAGFSFAYVELATGTGALILFGAVQATMILSGVSSGERPAAREWLGLLAALGGLVYLVSPGLAAPPMLPALLMAGAGFAWGVYSLRGRNAAEPIAATAGNFLLALPWAVALALPFLQDLRATPRGALLAVLSGAVTSGLGYVVWYAALDGLTATRAAIVQLAVPVIAAFAGVVLLDETITPRLTLAAVAILGGVALALGARSSGGNGGEPPDSTAARGRERP